MTNPPQSRDKNLASLVISTRHLLGFAHRFSPHYCSSELGSTLCGGCTHVRHFLRHCGLTTIKCRVRAYYNNAQNTSNHKLRSSIQPHIVVIKTEKCRCTFEGLMRTYTSPPINSVDRQRSHGAPSFAQRQARALKQSATSRLPVFRSVDAREVPLEVEAHVRVAFGERKLRQHAVNTVRQFEVLRCKLSGLRHGNVFVVKTLGTLQWRSPPPSLPLPRTC